MNGKTLSNGIISYSYWADYAWKNELQQQKNRVLQHLQEIVDDEKTKHNPHHMLERAFSLSAFCMRRLIECNLVTDHFLKTNIPIHVIPRSKDNDFDSPSLYFTGGKYFENYIMEKRTKASFRPKSIADKFLHARFFAVMHSSDYIPDGLLVSSDHQASKNVFHITSEEFDHIVCSFLGDHVSIFKDGVEHENGKPFSNRD